MGLHLFLLFLYYVYFKHVEVSLIVFEIWHINKTCLDSSVSNFTWDLVYNKDKTLKKMLHNKILLNYTMTYISKTFKRFHNQRKKWNLADSPPENDCARTSAVKAVLGLTVLVFSSNRCSPSTFLQRPYRKLCRMSDVMMSDRARDCCLNPAFRTRASAGNTEPMMSQMRNP